MWLPAGMDQVRGDLARIMQWLIERLIARLEATGTGAAAVGRRV